MLIFSTMNLILYLRVDHIGHTYSAHHPLMVPRLQRYDALVRRIIEEHLPDDALFLLFGDHGMTDGGNHGGASAEETDSALFVYSKQPIFPVRSKQAQEGAACCQKCRNEGGDDTCSDESLSIDAIGGDAVTTTTAVTVIGDATVADVDANQKSSTSTGSDDVQEALIWNSNMEQFSWVDVSALGSSPRTISQVGRKEGNLTVCTYRS
jgi:hypothetical protein